MRGGAATSNTLFQLPYMTVQYSNAEHDMQHYMPASWTPRTQTFEAV